MSISIKSNGDGVSGAIQVNGIDAVTIDENGITSQITLSASNNIIQGAGFVESPTVPTPALGDDYYNAANTAFVNRAIATGGKNCSIVKIQRGHHCYYAQTSDNRIFSWGYNNSYQLGQGSVNAAELVAEIQFPSTEINNDIIDFVVFGSSCYVLFTGGNLYVWGFNGHGQLGLGNTTNQASPVLSTTDVTNLYYPRNGVDLGHDGMYSWMFIKKGNGTFYVAGYNNFGQLGLGHTAIQTSWAAITPPTGKFIDTIWPGSNPDGSTFIRTTDNLIYASGYNIYGQLGLGHTTQQTSWQQVTFFNSIPVADIQCGGYFWDGTNAFPYYSTVVLSTAGNVYTTGNNVNGQLGDGTTTGRSTFAQVTLPKTVSRIIKSTLAVWVVYTDNYYARWGYNSLGQLGNGTVTNVLSPLSSSDACVNLWITERSGRNNHYADTFLLKSDGLYFAGNNAAGSGGIGNNSIGGNVPTFTLVSLNNLDILDIKMAGSGIPSQIICFNNSSKIVGAGYNTLNELNSALTGNKYSFRNLNIVNN